MPLSVLSRPRNRHHKTESTRNFVSSGTSPTHTHTHTHTRTRQAKRQRAKHIHPPLKPRYFVVGQISIWWRALFRSSCKIQSPFSYISTRQSRPSLWTGRWQDDYSHNAGQRSICASFIQLPPEPGRGLTTHTSAMPTSLAEPHCTSSAITSSTSISCTTDRHAFGSQTPRSWLTH